jgi:hypothetical protein
VRLNNLSVAYRGSQSDGKYGNEETGMGGEGIGHDGKGGEVSSQHL